MWRGARTEQPRLERLGRVVPVHVHLHCVRDWRQHQPLCRLLAACEEHRPRLVVVVPTHDTQTAISVPSIETAAHWQVLSRGAPWGGTGHRRDCRSAAPPFTFVRCFNRDGERASAKWQSRRRLAWGRTIVPDLTWVVPGPHAPYAVPSAMPPT